MKILTKCPHCGKQHIENREHSGTSIIECSCSNKFIAVARINLEVEALKIVDELILDRKSGNYVSKRTGKAVKS